jgi:hypothetical protein
MTSPVTAVEVRGLTQRFGERAAVDGMDLSVASSESRSGSAERSGGGGRAVATPTCREKPAARAALDHQFDHLLS